MTYLADRRQLPGSVRVATDRLVLPWRPLQDPRSGTALVVGWLAMSAILLLVAHLQLGKFTAIGLSVSTPPVELIEALRPLVLPLLQLLMALVLVRQTLRCLDFTGAAANLGLAILPLLPLAVASFTPMRADQAGWQVLCALCTLRLLVDRRRAATKAGFAGIAAAALANFTPDGIWLAAAAAAFLSLDYLRSGKGQAFAAFGVGLALGTAIFTAPLAPQALWSSLVDGASGWPFPLAWGAGGLVAAVLCCRARPPAMLHRIGALIAVFSTSAAILAVFGELALAWLPGWEGSLLAGYFSGKAIAAPAQWHDAAGMVAATLVLWLAAVILRRRELARSANPRGWLATAMLSGTMVFLALFSPRAALLAQVLAVPLLALMLRDALRVASRFASAPGRVMAIGLALLALTPTGGALAATLAVSLADGHPPRWTAPIGQVAAWSGANLPSD